MTILRPLLEFPPPSWAANGTRSGHSVLDLSVYRQPASIIETPPAADHIVAIHLDGAAPVELCRNTHTERMPLSRGAVTILPAQEPTSWCLQGTVSFLHLNIAQATLQNMAFEEGSCSGSRVQLVPRFGIRDSVVARIGTALLREARRPGLASNLYLEALQQELLVHLLRQHASVIGTLPSTRPPLSRRALRQVVEYVEGSLDEDLTVADLAKAAGMSSSGLWRCFRAATGLTPYQYLRQRRIERSKSLLLNSNMPVIDVALACGFANPQHFATVFKQCIGMSPRVFRRTM